MLESSLLSTYSLAERLRNLSSSRVGLFTYGDSLTVFLLDSFLSLAALEVDGIAFYSLTGCFFDGCLVLVFVTCLAGLAFY